MTRILSLLAFVLLLSSCSVAGDLTKDLLLGGDGPKVEAQIGKENTKQIVGNQQTVGRDLNKETVKADRVETVVVNEVPSWVILLLVLGWLLPSPNEIGTWIARKLKWQN